MTSSKINIFESRNQYELFVSILFAVNLFEMQGTRSLICSTQLLSPAVQSQINSMDGLEVFCLLLKSEANGFAVFLRLFIFYVKRIFKVRKFFVFHEVSPVVLLSFFKFRISLIEHGDVNYLKIPDLDYYTDSTYAWFKRYLLGGSYVGESSAFDDIYLKRVPDAPEKLQHKVKELDLKAMFDVLTGVSRDTLNAVFNYDPGQVENNIQQDYVVLITQPFSELGMVSQEAKIDIYREAVKHVAGQLIIKPHPKEVTNYKLCFPDAIILNPQTPFEVFFINGVSFKQAITVDSSAIQIVNCSNCIILGREVLQSR